MFKWARESLGFNIFLFCLITFNVISLILLGQMSILLFIWDAIILWISIDNILKILENRKVKRGG